MTTNLLSNEVIKKLKENEYVRRVSEKGITYTLEYRKLFMQRFLDGENELMIFE